jgi:hypothetical protein
MLAITMIDQAKSWFKIVEPTYKVGLKLSMPQISQQHPSRICLKSWLPHYPRPQFIVFENRGEFKIEFKQICDNYGIKAKRSTSHNHQSTSKCSHLASKKTQQMSMICSVHLTFIKNMKI